MTEPARLCARYTALWYFDFDADCSRVMVRWDDYIARRFEFSSVRLCYR